MNMNNKKLIRLTENDLHRIVKESVNKILREVVDDGDYENAMSARDTYTIEIWHNDNSVRITKNGQVIGENPRLKYLAEKNIEDLIQYLKPLKQPQVQP